MAALGLITLGDCVDRTTSSGAVGGIPTQLRLGQCMRLTGRRLRHCRLHGTVRTCTGLASSHGIVPVAYRPVVASRCMDLTCARRTTTGEQHRHA
jgi:hypothetical protein